MKQTKIGFFDSGIGGVTVLRECLKLKPNFQYLYYSDSIHNPYGDKSEEEVISIVSSVVSYLIDQGCYIIVIACNTASAICVSYLREKYPHIYFIAIEPAVKLAYTSNSLGGTLVMATKGTMDSEKFHILYEKYHRDNFYLLSCVGLANLIEHGDVEAIRLYLEENLSIYRGKVSSVVLGCTHYPIIKDEIRKVLGSVTFYDGAKGVALQLSNVIDNNNFKETGIRNVSFLDSSGDIRKEKRFKKLLEESYGKNN